MAHQSLYRKYRPQTFDDVVGQGHIERTLRNAVAEGSFAHAYLFTGPRGTGKTTTARIFAKALLCEKGPTPDPDATCEQCIDIAEGRHPDVFELDAASRTGIDNVREEIIGRVQFAPSRGRYKVYIIDEVHMLSTQAFNALLKTLEEPPPHVVFILATTHPHKVPETIHSRCQRFDFHRIGLEDLADRLRFISESEGFKVDRGAFGLIARHAEGGMRDAITTLEQLAAFTGGEITVDDVEGLLGEVDSAQLFEAAGLVARRDVAGAFRWVAGIVETGTDLAELVRALTAHVRDLFVVAAVGDAEGVVDRTAEDQARLRAQVAEFGGPDRLSHVLDMLAELAAEMRWSSDPRLSLEVALTRMSRPGTDLTLAALASRVEALEMGSPAGREGSAGPAQSGFAELCSGPAEPSLSPPTTQAHGRTARGEGSGELSNPAPAAAPATPSAPAPAVASDQPVVTTPRQAGEIDAGTARRSWQAVVMEIKRIKPARVQAYLACTVAVDDDGRTLVIEFPEDQVFSMQMADQAESRDMLKTALGAVFGVAPPFRFQLGRGAVRPPEPPAHRPEPPIETAEHAGPAHDRDTDDRVPLDAYDTGALHESPRVADELAAPAGEPATDLERLLVHGLGAKIVDEVSHETGEDE